MNTFLRHVAAKCDQAEETYLYRQYMTESVRLMGENKHLAISWHDLLDKTPPPPERTGDEIAAQVILAAGLHLE